MSFAAHGKWCGLGWSAGQWKDAKDLTEEDKLVPADDELDQACKEHDIGIAEGDPLANQKFYEKAAAASWYGLSLAQFVKIGGPPLQNYLRGGEDVNKKMKTRQNPKEEDYEAWKSKNSIRLKKKADDARSTKRTFQRDENRVYNAEDEEVMEALVDINGDFETPDRPTMRAAPTQTREDNPLRVERNVRDQAGNIDSLSNLLDRENNATMEDTEMATLRSADSGNTTGGQRGKKETPVRYNARAELGVFTETRTAYLPLTVYFSINRTRNYRPVPLKFRVDYPHDIFKRNTLVAQEIDKGGANLLRAHGLSNDMAKAGVRGSTAALAGMGSVESNDVAWNRWQLVPFPTTVKGDTAGVNGTTNAPATNGKSSSGAISHTNCRAAWSKWYCKQYQYAHCMETDWKVTYWSGDGDKEFQNVRIYEGHDVQSTGNTDTIPDAHPIGRMDHWPYLKKHNLSQRTNETPKDKYVISGTWKDSDHHPMSMIPNDEEIKTWSKVGDEDFVARENDYREDVVLLHFSNPDSANQPGFVNCRIDLRYEVQFKDLANSIRWFGSGIGKTLNTKDDTLQTPFADNTDTGVTSNPERVFVEGFTPGQLL